MLRVDTPCMSGSGARTQTQDDCWRATKLWQHFAVEKHDISVCHFAPIAKHFVTLLDMHKQYAGSRSIMTSTVTNHHRGYKMLAAVHCASYSLPATQRKSSSRVARHD